LVDQKGMSSYDQMLLNDHVELVDIFYTQMMMYEREHTKPYGMIHYAAGSARGSKCLNYLL
jgi:hypothetical protein